MEVGTAEKPLKARTPNGAIWRNLKIYFWSWNCKETLKIDAKRCILMQNPVMRVGSRVCFFSIIWLTMSLCLSPYIHLYCLFRIWTWLISWLSIQKFTRTSMPLYAPDCYIESLCYSPSQTWLKYTILFLVNIYTTIIKLIKPILNLHKNVG